MIPVPFMRVWWCVGVVVAFAACRGGFDAPGDAGDEADARVFFDGPSTAFDAGDGGMVTSRAVSAGGAHACAVVDGALWCWGSNLEGQLGQGDLVSRSQATRVAPDAPWLDVTVGGVHTCAIRADRTLWCWGGNASGQLGIGSAVTPQPSPQPVSLPRPVVVAASSGNHTCAILDDTSLWCWGANFDGQTAQNDPFDSPDVLAPSRVGADIGWSAIAGSDGVTLGILAGAARGSGRNTESQLGLGAPAPSQVRTMTAIDPGPWMAVSSALGSSCGLKADASAWCWGNNTMAQIALPALIQYDVPTLLDDTATWQTISVDAFGGCGINDGGVLRCWGRNDEGQIGFGSYTTTPLAPFTSGTFTDWTAFSMSRFHACGQRADGGVWCAGENTYGQVGTGDTMRRYAWTQVSLP